METDEIYKHIKNWASRIEELIYLADIKGKQYIKCYKLQDLQEINNIIKVCERCKKLFIPNPNFKIHQKYCDIQCRNQATRINAFKLKLDDRQKPVDLLRKTIYERKYRARRDLQDINIDGYDLILKKLSRLVKNRYNFTQEDYDDKIFELQQEYYKIVKGDKFSGKL